MTLVEGLTIIAILLSPIIALRVEKRIEHGREIKERKLNVFRTLMATRAARSNHRYVEALNMIDLTFTDKKEKPIREKWEEYLNELGKDPSPPVKSDSGNEEAKKKYDAENAQYKADLKSWNRRIDSLVVDLLEVMGKSLNYEFSRVHLEKGVYVPKAHGDIEDELRVIRHGLVQVLLGRWPLPMHVTSFPGPSEEAASQQEELRQLLINNLKGDKPLTVKVEPAEQIPPSSNTGAKGKSE